MGKCGLDLCGQRHRNHLWQIPVGDLSTDEVMGYSGPPRFAARQPLRQDRALAHTGAAGDHDPSRLAGSVEPLVELPENVLAPDEPDMPLPFCREVDQPRLGRQCRWGYEG